MAERKSQVQSWESTVLPFGLDKEGHKDICLHVRSVCLRVKDYVGCLRLRESWVAVRGGFSLLQYLYLGPCEQGIYQKMTQDNYSFHP